MAESSLSIGFVDLEKEVGSFLGYGRTPDNWSAAQETDIDAAVQSGVRQVYYPPAVDKSTIGYEWSWLRPGFTFDIEDGEGDYDLPDDFGRLIGSLYYSANEYRSSITIVSIGRILALRASTGLTGAPYYAATRYKTSDGSDGQRQEILFYPEPDSDWTLYGSYEAYSGALSDSYPYPLGGMQLAELYIESCLAIAEQRFNDEIGIHNQKFSALLVDAVARDSKRGARFYGPMGHIETTSIEFRRGWTGSEYPIVYKDVTY